MANDVFAQIASNGIGGRQWLLEEKTPAPHTTKECLLTTHTTGEYPAPEKPYTKEALYADLNCLREKMKPFLADLAPVQETYTKKAEIRSFLLDGKDTVTIPHYCGPIGKACKTYDAVFSLEKNAHKAYYICFKGADYYAVVYINGICVGTHEGFFSPFEFQITDVVKQGKNTLRIELYNDHIYGGNDFDGAEDTEGDKLYAATGLGWDGAEDGWHHCPAGMGLYGKVFLEERNPIHLTDLFVRPMESEAELWIEVNYAGYKPQEITLRYSIYGQNFRQTVCEDVCYIPETVKTVGMGDSLTEAQMKEQLGKGVPMPVKNGPNIFRIPVRMANPKIWKPDTPYLYQLQVTVLVDGNATDTRSCQFGMRTFTQDTTSEKKGMFYLNGEKIRLRGANTMGFEQQDVLREDWNQLIDDILLAKLCNMNFLRLTQRPVQEEVYEYCDKLGMLTQSDLPLFGCMRRTKIAEGIRQTEEMEKIVRKHPCNVVISYINEPFPNAKNEPHRHLQRHELEEFFQMCDMAVKLLNPDQVIKHVDGDYDPPTTTMPDNHCYPMWYNGHGIDIGKLHKGYWLPVAPGWYYGCGEYGAEGLDSVEVMRQCYPAHWLKVPFDPNNIVGAQTGSFSGFFYDRQDCLEEWVTQSQRHQAFATKMMTEAFRRNDDMVSFAIHLFIDAWPSGWMKTIMDCKRIPKQAYFAYRDALAPIMLSLRTDRFTYYADEPIRVECFICNDTHIEADNYRIVYELYRKGVKTHEGIMDAALKDCSAGYSSECLVSMGDIVDRETVTLRAILLDGAGNAVCDNTIDLEVFARLDAAQENSNVILINPPIGTYQIAGEQVEVKACGMLPVHFASRKTGHSAVAEFSPRDFSYWYNAKEDCITPIAEKTFTAPGFTPILLGNNTDADGNWGPALICGEKEHDGKRYIVCTLDIREENPVAQRFLRNLMSEL